uniref:Liver-expressed antimicrobial peptide 2 n=1 Tax=Cyprinus carpio carpio TaxID=630221 RepID=A0A8C1HME4_CYPCA
GRVSLLLTGGYIRQYIVSVVSVTAAETFLIQHEGSQSQRGSSRLVPCVFGACPAECVFQVTCSPVPKLDTPSTSVQEVQRSLKRTARTTPLWRIMGTKPHGAYCQNNYECSTGICRKGHCSYSQPINS